MPLPRRLLCLLSTLLLTLPAFFAHAQAYTSIVIFGDSLSDTGNVAHLTQSKYTITSRIPGPVADYTDGRFTDGTDTVPAAHIYSGVWIEQLAGTLPAKPVVKNSLDGGTDYAYGFGTTADATSIFTFGPGNSLSVIVNNVGQQVTDYLATAPVITNKTLFVVWAGANDLLNATTSADITNAAARDVAIVQRLIAAGATDFIIPNLPPLGAVPRFNGSVTASATNTQAAAAFNQALAAGLAGLPSANPGKTLHVFPLDVFSLFNTIIGPPITGGLANATSSAQGSPLINPDTYLFWDDLHPTTAGHHLLAAAAAGLLTPVSVATATTVTSSALTSNLASSVTFTATVGASAGSPTGTVTFLDGTTTLGTGTLSAASATSSTATFSTSTLTAGTHTITATYAGAAGFTGSTSAAITQTVTAPALQAALAPTSVTIARGSTGTSTLTLTPVGGYSGTATFACGTLPAHLSCTFAPASLTFSGTSTAQSSTLTIGTTATAALRTPAMPGSSAAPRIFSAFAILPFLGFAGIAAFRRRRPGHQSIRLLLLLALLSAGATLGITGCGGDSNKAAAGTYTVPVNVTAAGSTSNLSLTVVVQ